MLSGKKRRFNSARRERLVRQSIPVFVAEALEGRVLLSGGTFTVSNLNDSGAGSLRQAITDADAAGGTDIINFVGVSGTIDLASALPAISSNITVNGPGVSELTVNGGGFGSVFTVNSGVTSEIEGLTITGGKATFGGGIFNLGALTVANSNISGNSTPNQGGGIDNVGNGTLTVTDSTIAGNSSNFLGGGVSNSAGALNADTVTIFDSTISGNYAEYAGGGINNGDGNGMVTVANSTISGNSTQDGGGISGPSTIVNSTISGNTGTLAGGGIEGYGNVTDSTISGNVSPSVGGIYGQGYLNGTIVAGNSGGDLKPIFTQLPFTGSNDLIGDGSDGGVLTNSLRGTVATPLNPMLTPLGEYGGPTQTMALLSGSPAIGAGANFPVLDANGNDITATDQRGVARPATGIDIGAYQSGVLVVNTLTDPATSTTGILSLREAIGDANTIGGNNTIDFASGLAGTIGVTSLLPAINSNITIDGPGAGLLTVNGGRHGHVFAIDAGATSEIEGVTISGGKGSYAGGIYNLGALTVTNSTISGNSSLDYGGGIFNAENATLAVIDSIISGNSSVTDGGGISNIAGVFGANTVRIYDSTISGNSAGQNGGGLDCEYSGGFATVTNCTISGNTAMFGGGITGPCTVISSTISGNRAHETGGGMLSAATIINSTISGNTATAAGAIAGEVYSTDSSIVGNSVTEKKGVALYLIGGTSVINGTIIANNQGSEIDIGIDAHLEGSNDLIGDGSDGGVLTNSLRGTAANPLNPMLAPLGDYGGPTETMPELPGSPAIGAGANFDNLATDQRGFVRLTTSGVDIGADQGALFAGDTNFDGIVNLTDLLTLLNNYGQTGANWTQGDFNFDGTVNLTDLLILLNHYAQSANDNSVAPFDIAHDRPAAAVVSYKAASSPFASGAMVLNFSANDVDGEILGVDSGGIL